MVKSLYSVMFWLLLCSGLCAQDHARDIEWRDWEGAFVTARGQEKLVLLNLEAVWCHWCHVMEKTTYRDPRVRSLLSEAYVSVKVDQDARPDLGNRYADYGWPATIIFDSQGQELARLSGYVEADRMVEILTRLRSDPKPMESVEPPVAARGPGSLDKTLIERLESRHYDLYDQERGGWGRIHKFLNPGVVEYCLRRAQQGDEENARMARQTLDANLALLDPVWGGVYQYSDSGRWDRPHFEKIMATQAGNLRVYSLAYAQFNDSRYLEAADQIATYLMTFLRSPEGAFYASQDADLKQGQKASAYFELDDEQRRRQGLPRIDEHLYARENGLAIEALALYAAVSEREDALESALEATRWVLEHRLTPEGLFRHGEGELTTLFLGDTLAMGRAFLMLYRVTGEPEWLERANQCAQAMKSFAKEGSDGYFTSTQRQVRDRLENIALARFATLLHAHLGEQGQRLMAERALAYFAIEDVTDYFNPGGLLLAALESRQPPTHITVVGASQDPRTMALLKVAVGAPTAALRLDRWEPGTPLPPHSEVAYPDLGYPAAFLCSGNRCSRPLATADELRQAWSRL